MTDCNGLKGASVSLGSSNSECVGDEWVREDSNSEGGVVTGHFMPVSLHVHACMQCLCIPGSVIRCSTLEDGPS